MHKLYNALQSAERHRAVAGGKTLQHRPVIQYFHSRLVRKLQSAFYTMVSSHGPQLLGPQIIPLPVRMSTVRILYPAHEMMRWFSSWCYWCQCLPIWKKYNSHPMPNCLAALWFLSFSGIRFPALKRITIVLHSDRRSDANHQQEIWANAHETRHSIWWRPGVSISPGLGIPPGRDRQTDRRTDRIPIANTRLSSTCQSAGTAVAHKNWYAQIANVRPECFIFDTFRSWHTTTDYLPLTRLTLEQECLDLILSMPDDLHSSVSSHTILFCCKCWLLRSWQNTADYKRE